MNPELLCPVCQVGYLLIDPDEPFGRLWHCGNHRRHQCLLYIYNDNLEKDHYRFALDGLGVEEDEILLEFRAPDFDSAMRYFQRVWKLKSFL